MKGTTLTRWPPSFLLIVTIYSSLAKARPQIHYVNKCSYPMYLWPTAQSPVPDSQYTLVKPYSKLSTPMTWLPAGGISVKIRDVDHYAAAPAGILQVEYSFQQSNYFYDLSYIDCDQYAPPESPNHCPFAAGGVLVHTTGYDNGYSCRKLHCQLPGECRLCYLNHGSWYGEPTTACSTEEDLIVETCVDGEGARTHGKTDHHTPHKRCWGGMWGDCSGLYDRQQEIKVKRQDQDPTPEKGPRTEDITPTSSVKSTTSETSVGTLSSTSEGFEGFAYPPTTDPNFVYPETISRFSTVYRQVEKAESRSLNSAAADINPRNSLQEVNCRKGPVPPKLYVENGVTKTGTAVIPHSTHGTLHPRESGPMVTKAAVLPRQADDNLILEDENSILSSMLLDPSYLIYEDNGVTKTGTKIIFEDQTRRRKHHPKTKAAVLPRQGDDPRVYVENGVTKTGTSYTLVGTEIYDPYNDPQGHVPYQAGHGQAITVERPVTYGPVWVVVDGVTTTPPYVTFIGTEIFDPYHDPSGRVPYEYPKGTMMPHPPQPWPQENKVRRQGYPRTLHEENGVTQTATH